MSQGVKKESGFGIAHVILFYYNMYSIELFVYDILRFWGSNSSSQLVEHLCFPNSKVA